MNKFSPGSASKWQTCSATFEAKSERKFLYDKEGKICALRVFECDGSRQRGSDCGRFQDCLPCSPIERAGHSYQYNQRFPGVCFLLPWKEPGLQVDAQTRLSSLPRESWMGGINRAGSMLKHWNIRCCKQTLASRGD